MQKKIMLFLMKGKRLLELSADGQMGDNPFGGELHEEVICRVVNMEEIEAG